MSTKTHTDILKTLGLDTLPDKTQMELLQEMTESVLKRITIEILQGLSEEDQKELLALQEGAPDPEKAEEFIRARVSDFETIKAKVVKEFTEEMRETVAMLREGVTEAA